MKRGQSKAQQQYIQGFFKKKPCQRQVDAVQCSAGQNQSTKQGQVGQQISSPDLAAQVRAGQWRLQPAAIYLQQQNMSNFYKKFTRHSHTHCLFGQWKKLRTSILLLSGFIYKKRDELSRHMCSALFMSSHLCWGTWLFPWAPPDWILAPLCHPIKKILESPLTAASKIEWVVYSGTNSKWKLRIR